ncbi:hypothetical protein ABLE91_22965 [Aquabacter sp. CN5-332]|uniref:hypothetical protein n=1 Tax=Aquabacter sp. CN5-332 TaxID=3156608 RepID=UPI0032B52940
MTGPSGDVRPMPMEGHGAYNRNSRVQAAGLLPAVTLLQDATRIVPLESGTQPVLVADYGASSGRNSLVPMAAAIGVLRERLGPERAISIVHTDLPGNDFTALFQTLEDDPDSYLKGDPAAFASAVGRSFYEQILPPESVTLGWSSWAVQWLSRVPAVIPDQVQIAFSRDPDACAAFARQAAQDWRTFLFARSRELRPGGRLVVLTMAVDDAGEFGYRPLLAAIQATLEGMVREGFIRPDELRLMAIPTVGRSRAELAAPLEDGGLGGLTIAHLEVFHAEDRIWAQFEADGDAQAFGAQWAAFSRASVFPTLAGALEGGRDDPRAAGFMERLEAGTRVQLAAAPEPMLIPLAKMVIAKDVPAGG